MQALKIDEKKIFSDSNYLQKMQFETASGTTIGILSFQTGILEVLFHVLSVCMFKEINCKFFF